MQALDVFLGHAALGADLVDEAGHKPDHRVGHVAAFRLLEAALRVKALSNTAGNAAKERNRTVTRDEKGVKGQAAHVKEGAADRR